MPQGDVAAAQPDRSYCRLLGWKVFAPGFHNRELYPPARVATVPANFATLKGVLVPTGKLGHDRQQRLLQQIGFPNVGQVTRCEPTPDGGYEIDLDRVPVDVGEVVNAGWLNSGSVELKENVRDPRDPGKKLPGDVLVAVALLGEEQPALPGMAPPRATFPDGSPVPAATRMPGWLDAMADVARQMSARYDPGESKIICFSAMFQEPPVTPDEIIAALASMSPEDKAKVAAAAGAAAPAPVEPDAALADDPAKKGDAPPDFAAFVKKYADDREADRKCMSDLTARLGAMEADRTKQMSAEADKEEKQFSAEVTRVVDAAVRGGHLQPWQKAMAVTHGKSLRTAVFSDGPNKGQSEFAAWAAALEAGNTSVFSDRIADAPPTSGPLDARGQAVLALTPLGRSVLGTLTAAK